MQHCNLTGHFCNFAPDVKFVVETKFRTISAAPKCKQSLSDCRWKVKSTFWYAWVCLRTQWIKKFLVDFSETWFARRYS